MPANSERRRTEILKLFEAAKRLKRGEVKEADRQLWREHVGLGGDVVKVAMGNAEGMRFVTPEGEDVFEAEYTLYTAWPVATRPPVQPTGAEMASVLYDAAGTIIREASRRHVVVEVRDGELEPVAVDRAGIEILELARLLLQAQGRPAPKCRSPSCGRRLDPSKRVSAYCSQACQKREWRSGRSETTVGADA